MISYKVRCRVSGGVTGTREADLTENGKPVRFDTLDKADAKARELNAKMNHMYSVAFFEYWPEPSGETE